MFYDVLDLAFPLVPCFFPSHSSACHPLSTSYCSPPCPHPPHVAFFPLPTLCFLRFSTWLCFFLRVLNPTCIKFFQSSTNPACVIFWKSQSDRSVKNRSTTSRPSPLILSDVVAFPLLVAVVNHLNQHEVDPWLPVVAMGLKQPIVAKDDVESQFGVIWDFPDLLISNPPIVIF